MSSARNALLAATLALSLLSACGEDPATGVLVIIDATPEVRSVVGALALNVSGGAQLDALQPAGFQQVDVGQDDWPVTAGLVPRGGDASRVWSFEIVALERLPDGAMISRITHRETGAFDPGRVTVLEVLLQHTCFDVHCRDVPGTTCIGGTCETVPFHPTGSLPRWDGNVPDGGDDGGLADGGDASVDSSLPECMMDEQCDDGDACTTDHCAEGRCAFDSKVCDDDGDPCTVEECDSVSGDCESPVAPDGTMCGSDMVCCGGSCLDTSADELNCGACGMVCGANQSCMGGRCQCDDGFQDCDGTPGCESSRMTDPGHCGSCGVSCSEPTPSCIGGSCAACTGAGDCGDDGLPCTDAMCTSGLCSYPIRTGCVIDGGCVADRAVNPMNRCQECNASRRTDAWSNRATGATCDDGQFCTTGETCNGSGVCSGGTSRGCGDAFACTMDTCDEGTDRCVNTLVAGRCLISGACRTTGEVNPGNLCQECDPARSTSAWSPATGDSCDDSMFCTTGETCTASGTCAGGMSRSCGAPPDMCTTLSCNEMMDMCEGAHTSGCVIGGTCYGEGATNPAMPCQVCDSARSSTSWSMKADGASCPAGGMCFGGTCVGTSSDGGTPGDGSTPDAGPGEGGPRDSGGDGGG